MGQPLGFPGCPGRQDVGRLPCWRAIAGRVRVDPGSIEQVIMKALSKSPTLRYPDAVAFARALEGALAVTEEPSKPGLISRMKDIFKR